MPQIRDNPPIYFKFTNLLRENSRQQKRGNSCDFDHVFQHFESSPMNRNSIKMIMRMSESPFTLSGFYIHVTSVERRHITLLLSFAFHSIQYFTYHG